MAKIDGPKGALLATVATASLLTGCGGGSGTKSPDTNTSNPGGTPPSTITNPDQNNSNSDQNNTQQINHAPVIHGLPTNIVSLTEGVKDKVAEMYVLDPDYDKNITVTVSSSDSNIPVEYNNGNILVDATNIDVPNGDRKEITVSVTASDGDLNTTKTFPVSILDTADDALLSYTKNIPNSTLYNGTLSGSITLRDNDGLSQNSYMIYLLDSNGNEVYAGTMNDYDGDGTYTFNIDFSNLNLQVGRYKLKTEAIEPVIGGENPQSPIVIEQNVNLIAPAPEFSFGLDSSETNTKVVVGSDGKLYIYIYTPDYGGDDYEARLVVKVTNGGYVMINGTRYNDGDVVSLYDQQASGNPTGEIKIYDNQDNLVKTQTYVIDGVDKDTYDSI